MAEEWVQLLEGGFDAWRALPPLRFDRWQAHRDRLGPEEGRGLAADCLELLPGARTLLVLLTAYGPWRDWPGESLWIHPHYPAYHRAAGQTGRLVERIGREGYRAVSASRLPQRHAAFAAGFGTGGLNGLLIHRRFGSRVCFHTVLTDMPLPLSEPRAGEMRGCLRCGACLRACPVGALPGDGTVDAGRCLRHYAPMRRDIPEDIRGLLGMRLLGCDECQRVCPMNRPAMAPAVPPGELVGATRLRGLLDWQGAGRAQVGTLGRLIGGNEARPVRMTAAAAMHAGNSGDPSLVPALRRLASHPDARVREMAAWSAGRLEAGAPGGPPTG